MPICDQWFLGNSIITMEILSRSWKNVSQVGAISKAKGSWRYSHKDDMNTQHFSHSLEIHPISRARDSLCTFFYFFESMTEGSRCDKACGKTAAWTIIRTSCHTLVRSSSLGPDLSLFGPIRPFQLFTYSHIVFCLFLSNNSLSRKELFCTNLPFFCFSHPSPLKHLKYR